MITLKTARKHKRRAAEQFAARQLTTIAALLAPVALENEVPTVTLRRVLQERDGLRVDILVAWLESLRDEARADVEREDHDTLVYDFDAVLRFVQDKLTAVNVDSTTIAD